MDEIIDELRSVAEPVPVPLELPDHDSLVIAQEQILMPLPTEFVEFLLSVSDVVYGTMEPVTVADPQSHTYLPEVTAAAWDAGMPRHLVALCEYDGGYYGVADDGEVQYWSADSGISEETWETVWYWVRDVWLNS